MGTGVCGSGERMTGIKKERKKENIHIPEGGFQGTLRTTKEESRRIGRGESIRNSFYQELGGCTRCYEVR